MKFYPGDIPTGPGVYIFRDSFGVVIYIGKATNLRKRVSSYFQKSRINKNDPKLRSLVNSINSLEFNVVKNEDEALILESRLIKEYAPRYNILLRDDKRFLLIKIKLFEKFPKFTLARINKKDSATYFGPFPKGNILRETMIFLSRYFGIRTCKTQRPTEVDHKHCLSSVIKDCCIPCINLVTEDEYKEKVNAMLAVLSGDITDILCELRKKMDNASKKLRFEEAGKWRDIISNITTIFGTKNRSFKYKTLVSYTPEEAIVELKNVLLLNETPKMIECFDNSNIAGELAVSSMVCFKNGKPSKKDYRRFKIKTVNQIDDFATMEEVITRHYKRKLKEHLTLPDLLIVDGGKGQLSAAVKALSRINCNIKTIIGLAKRNEEIFLVNKSNPIVLDKYNSALKLLQAIRDESHRFAITFHRTLRDKRIEESILDEIKGIGKKRKIEILKAFSSICELRKASVKDIQNRVPNLGKTLALTILQYLQKSK